MCNILEGKFCIKCGELKSFNKFNKTTSKYDGYNSYCKYCQSLVYKKYYINNPEITKIHRNNYRFSHKQHDKDYSKQYYNKNREMCINKNKQFKYNIIWQYLE